jgi:UPF0176 protein
LTPKPFSSTVGKHFFEDFFMQITNIAGYKFITLSELIETRETLLQRTMAYDCKGTILLSHEGININLAGTAQAIVQFKAALKMLQPFEDIQFKESFSEVQPFRFMRVKIKNEIITMHKANIRPDTRRAQSIQPSHLKKWLDDGKDFTLLDTRNDYEVQFGSFEKAEHLHIDDFGEFPEASKQLKTDKPIVMFCTGGIRCEKAALELVDAGFKDVYQLDGGILNYFSEVGGDHYDGECFVFDGRISLDHDLCETGTKQCLRCQGPIKPESSAVLSACQRCD